MSGPPSPGDGVRDALLVVDVQTAFALPATMIEAIASLARRLPSVATVELHDETATPFAAQLGWTPPGADAPLVGTDAVFVKHGYLPPAGLVGWFRARAIERVLVCGVQTDTCCLAAGFMLFDAGLRPTLLRWLTRGSSLDRPGDLGARLWRHHFGNVLETERQLPAALRGAAPHATTADHLGGTTRSDASWTDGDGA